MLHVRDTDSDQKSRRETPDHSLSLTRHYVIIIHKVIMISLIYLLKYFHSSVIGRQLVAADDWDEEGQLIL